MNKCPICGRSVDKEPACPACGFQLSEAAAPQIATPLVTVPPGDATVAPPPNPRTAVTAAELRAAIAAATPKANPAAATAAPDASAAKPGVAPAAPQQAAQPRKSPQRSRMMVALAGGGLAAMVLLVLATRTPATGNEVPANVAPTPVQKPAASREEAPAPQLASDVEPRANWVSHRGRYGADAVVFELAANEDITVRRKRVRPMLAVRCVARTADVYVVTRTAAAFERDTNQHTVEMSFDGGDAITQMWDHSVDHDALFAADSKNLVRKIAGAKTMSFRFSPFNSLPTTVSFPVAGLDAQLESAARTCGLKPAAPPSRRRSG